MTIHILVWDASAQENCHSNKKVTTLLMTQCRTYGARILFGIDTPALPGWADVWRSALRASHPWRLPVSFLSQVAAGKSAARDDKGEGVTARCIRWLVGRTTLLANIVA